MKMVKSCLEDSESKFTVGEIITGRNSGATATVLVDDVDDGKGVVSASQFIIGELITGSQSGVMLQFKHRATLCRISNNY